MAAKTFSVAQNAQTYSIDLALVLTVGNTDFLYLSRGNANTDASWANEVTWTAIPFDAGTAPSPLTIADTLLMNISAPGGAGATENIFVDILRTPGDPLELLDRYYITPDASPHWNLHKLANDLSAGSISSCLGNRPNYPLPGIYTFGTISSTQELMFTPQYNLAKPQDAAPVTHFNLPAGASSVASALNSSGYTNLFVAATGGLYVFTPDNQHDQAVPVLIATNSLVAGANSLAAATSTGQTAVWGIDPQGNLFYTVCPAGKEADATAWLNPLPLLQNTEKFAFFLNLSAGNKILFAHIDEQNLVQLTQDPVTTDWLQRSILLPGTQPDDMAVYESFTTHIQVTDDYGVGTPNAAVAVTATSPVSVYLNNVYHLLSATVAVNTNADATGVLTIVQETQTLAGICLHIELTDGSGVTADIDPVSKAMAILGTIQTGNDLGSVQVTNADGTQQPLVPAGASQSDKDAAAASLVQFVKIASGLPKNGSRQNAAGSALMMATARPITWGMSFEKGSLTYYEGNNAAALLGLHMPAPVLTGHALQSNAGSVGSVIKVAAGDFFQWLKKAFGEVLKFSVQEAEGLYHFLAQVGDAVYDVLLDCVSAVVHAVKFVFNKIKVFFEDLIKWLGFLFEWGDIILTHKVLKNVLKQCAIRAINQIVTMEDEVKSAFDGIEKKIDAWAGIPDTTTTIGSYQATSSGTPKNGSPQAHWALHHAKGNVSASSTSYSTPNNNTDPLRQIFNDLETMVDTEIDDLKIAAQRLKTEVIDVIATLTPAEAMKRIAAIITDAILSTAENIIVTSLDIVKVVIEGIVDLLDAPISIPILSGIYKQITGDKLSFLDLACLIIAIPATIIYKAAAGKAPFSAADAQALGNAQDFASLQALLTGNTPHLASQKMALSSSDPVPDASSLLSTLGIVADFAAMFGALGVAIVAALKKTETEAGAPPPAPLRYLAATLYLPYVAPDFVQALSNPGTWFTILNDVVTIVATGKTFADNSDTPCAMTLWSNYISPVAESLTNIVWLIPAAGIVCAVEDPKASDWLSFAGNMTFDLGGGITFASEEKIISDPKIALGFFIGIEVLNVGYGLLSAGTGIALIGNN